MLSSHSGQDGCEDVDECAQDEDNACSDNASCENIDGGYMCICAEGFEGNGVVCIGMLHIIITWIAGMYWCV